MNRNMAVERPPQKYLFPFLFFFLVLAFSTSAQTDFRGYDYWTHPAIKALERQDPNIIAFPKRGDNLVNLCIADTAAGIAYFVSQYGSIFDTLQLTDARNKEIRISGKQANPFRWYEASVSQYLPVLQQAKEFLRENGSDIKKANYLQQRILTLPGIKKAASTLAKLLAIEEMEKDCKGILIHFDWNSHQPTDTSIENRLREGKKPGSLIMHGTPDIGYSEFINKELLSGIRTARLEHATGIIGLFDWKNQPVDSFLIQKSKVELLLQEKTDVFVLYRVWLERSLYTINALIPVWQYASNREWLKNKDRFFNVRFAGESNSKINLSRLQQEKNKVLDKIAALADIDAALFSTIIAHPRYDGYQEQREWSNMLWSWMTQTSHITGNKRYELTDHRGNVMATVSDRKTGIDINGDGTIDRYEADITTATDYYPFGSSMPGRKDSTENRYRYGFNGKENDNEVKGEGNQQDYGMRIYDPRLGRFLSVDPIAKEYPWYSPYQFAGNTPIWAIDLDGLEPGVRMPNTGWGPDNPMVKFVEGATKSVLKSIKSSFQSQPGGRGYSEPNPEEIASPSAMIDQVRNDANKIVTGSAEEKGEVTGRWIFPMLFLRKTNTPKPLGPLTSTAPELAVVESEAVAVSNLEKQTAANKGTANKVLPKSKRESIQSITAKRTDPQIGDNFVETRFSVSEGLLVQGKGKMLNGGYDFVVTEDGKLHIGLGHYNLSGGANSVQAAGQLKVWNGKITSVNNLSGHYTPNAVETSKFGQALENAGANVSGAKLQTYTGDQKTPINTTRLQ